MAPSHPSSIAAAAPASERRLELAVFLAVVAFTYGSITRGLVDGNTWSRMGLVFAVVERGTLDIDPVVLERRTDDWARSGGHHYSNKAPGPALLAVPFYLAQRLVQRSFGVSDDAPLARDAAAYIANLTTSIIPTLVALAFLRGLLVRRLGVSQGMAFALCGTWAIASLALPYSVLFFGHQTAAAFFTIAMCLSAPGPAGQGDPRTRRPALAGLAMGLAVISDYLCAALAAVWMAHLAWRDRRRLGPFLLGGAAPVLAALAYNAACFGSPFTTAYDLAFLNPRFAPIAAWEAPSLARLADVTVRPWRGLFYCTPVFALLLVGLDRLRVEARRHPDLVPAAAGVLLYFGLLAAFPSAYGGFCVGPRYVTPALPFALLLLAPAARMLPRLFGALAAAGAVLMLAATLTDPLPDERIQDPFREHIFPMLAAGSPGPMRNVFSAAMGLSLRVAFVAYLALWGAAAVWLAVRLRSPRAAPGPLPPAASLAVAA